MVATSEASSLDRIARQVWTPPERLTVDEWADRYRVLIAEASAEPGRWSTARTPYLRGPMRAFTDPRVRKIVLMFGSQLGKTEMVANCLFYVVDRDPGPTLFVYPNDKLATSTNRDRLVPTIQAMAALAAHLTESPQDVKGLQITFDSMNLWFTGANNTTNVKGRPCRYVFKDETEEFPTGVAALAEERVKTFPDSKVIDTSTPGDAGLGIDAEYSKSDQRRYEVPCPHCGVYQELIFDERTMVWDGGSMATPDQVERTTRYVCPHCGCECYEHDKAGMLERGVWVREGQRVEKDGTVVGEALRPDSAVAGFRLSSLYSPFSSCSWGAVARRYAEDGFVLTREFVTGYLGRPWALKADSAETKELDALMVSVADGGYPCRTAPVKAWDEGPGPMVLVGGIDVQQDSCWWAVYGFGAGGRDVFVIDFGQVLAGRGGDLVELEALLGYEAERHLAPGQTGAMPAMRPVVWALDTGHRTKECYTFCRRAGLLGKRVIPTKGRETMPTPHAVSRLDKFPDGTPMPGGLALLHVNTDHWKESIVGMIKRQADGRAAAVAGRLYLPDPDANDGKDGPILREFGVQVTAEHKVGVPDRNASKRGLRPVLKSEWRLKPKRRNNHALDTLVGALAVADAMGIRTLGAAAERPPEIKRMPAPEPRPGRQWNRGNTQWKERMNRMRERMAARR